MAVVAHSEHGVITLVGGASLDVVRVLRGFEELRYSAAPPAGRLAFVTHGERGEVIVLDVIRPRVVGRVRVGACAPHFTIDPAGRREVLKTLAGDAPPQHVSFLGGRAYVTSGDSGTLRVCIVVAGRAQKKRPDQGRVSSRGGTPLESLQWIVPA